MNKGTVAAALAAVLVALAVVSGFLALDKTVLHLYYPEDSEPTPTKTPRPAPTATIVPQLTASEAVQLAENWLYGNPFTDQTEDILYAECHDVELNTTTSKWVLTCGISFPSEQVAPPAVSRTFTVRVDSVSGLVEVVR